MTNFEIYYRKFERNPKRHQLSNDFKITMEQVFGKIEAADIDIITTSYLNTIERIVNKNFGKNFHHNNDPNQIYYTQK